jgi:hypothetical protein
VTVAEDAERERARGYYERGAIRIEAGGSAKTGPSGEIGPTGEIGAALEIGDGGFTDWTARLLNNAKERCLISCVATERLAAAVAAAEVSR